MFFCPKSIKNVRQIWSISLIFRLFAFLPPHFPDIFLGKHIVFHFLSFAIGVQKKWHGNQEKSDCSRANEFVGQHLTFIREGESVNDRPERCEDDKKDEILHGLKVDKRVKNLEPRPEPRQIFPYDYYFAKLIGSRQ